jgi:hypothetical protein
MSYFLGRTIRSESLTPTVSTIKLKKGDLAICIEKKNPDQNENAFFSYSCWKF